MRIKWVGPPVSMWFDFTVVAAIIWLGINALTFYLIYQSYNMNNTAKELISKQNALISQLEYKVLNCRINTINEIMEGGEAYRISPPNMERTVNPNQ
jgi:hypothetical protein